MQIELAIDRRLERERMTRAAKTYANHDQAVRAVAPAHPPCFSAQERWVVYLQSAAAEKRGTYTQPVLLITDGKAEFNPRFNFCRDCALPHKTLMVLHGKCKPKHLIEIQPQPKEPTK